MPRHATRRRRQPPAAAGLGTLMLGFILAAAGAYFLTNQVQVGAGPFGGFGWFGPNSFGLLLVPLIVGVGLVCFDARSPVGRVLVAGGAVLVVASVLDTLRLTFRPTSLFNTLMMLVLLVAGVGLMARALLGGRNQSESFDIEEVDDEKEPAQGRFDGSHVRMHGLEAPQREQLAPTPIQTQTVDDQLAELVRRKRNTPAS